MWGQDQEPSLPTGKVAHLPQNGTHHLQQELQV